MLRLYEEHPIYSVYNVLLTINLLYLPFPRNQSEKRETQKLKDPYTATPTA